jgi:hypothetical protein
MFSLGKCRAETGDISGKPKAGETIITPWGTNVATPVYPMAVSTAAAISLA